MLHRHLWSRLPVSDNFTMVLYPCNLNVFPLSTSVYVQTAICFSSNQWIESLLMWKQLTCITNKYHRKQEWHGGDKEHCFHLDALHQNDCQSDFKNKTIETFPNFMHTHRERGGRGQIHYRVSWFYFICDFPFKNKLE